MRNWRVLTAIAAVVLAGVAGVLAYQYLTEADERAQEDVELVDVLVARGDIPKGTTGREALDQELIEQREVPRNVVPESILTDTRGIGDLVAASAVSKGQFIVRDTFVAPSQIGGFSTSLEEGKQAITILVDDTRGVAGFVTPNDRVNVIYQASVRDLGDPQGGGELKMSAYLLPGLRVLAVGETTLTSPPPAEGAEAEARASTGGLITLEVTERQALQISHAVQYGSIYLTLNPPDFEPKDFAKTDEIVELVNLLDPDITALTILNQTQEQIRALSPEG